MMRVKSFVYCKDIIYEPTSSSEKIKLVQPLGIFRLNYIPNNFSFSILFNLYEINLHTSNNIKVVFFNPKGEVVINYSDDLLITQSEEGLPLKFQGATIFTDLKNVLIEYEGEYKTQIFVNDELIDEFEIYALKTPSK